MTPYPEVYGKHKLNSAGNLKNRGHEIGVVGGGGVDLGEVEESVGAEYDQKYLVWKSGKTDKNDKHKI